MESPFTNFRRFPADGAVFAATMTLSMQDPLTARCRRAEVFERVFGAIPAFAGWLEPADGQARFAAALGPGRTEFERLLV